MRPVEEIAAKHAGTCECDGNGLAHRNSHCHAEVLCAITDARREALEEAKKEAHRLEQMYRDAAYSTAGDSGHLFNKAEGAMSVADQLDILMQKEGLI